MAMQPFVWGAKGEQLTPQQVERRRIAALLQSQRATDTSPVGDWTQAAARGLNGFLAGRGERNADRQENAGLASADLAIQGNPVLSALMGGQQMPGMTPAPVGVGPVQPMAEGMPSGGLPASIVQSESGGNWNALNSEGYGGRGQFGADRLADAARAGVIPAGMDGAAYSQAAPEVQTAVENWHKQDIMNSLGQYVGVDPDGPGPIPALTPDSLLAVAHLGGTGGARRFVESGGQYNPADSNGTSLADYAIRHAGGPQAGAVPQGMMSSAPQAPSGVVAALAAAQSNPWVAQKYGPVLEALMGQEMGRQDLSYQQQLAQRDPMYQAQLQAAQIANQQAMMPQAQKPIEVGGVLLDPTTYQPIFDSRQGTEGGFTLGEGQARYDAQGNLIAQGAQAPADVFRPATTEEAAAFGSPAGQFGPDGRFYPVNPPSGMTIESDGRGGFRMVQGAGAMNAQDDAMKAVNQADQMLSSIDGILNDPALDNATGLLSPTQRIPGTDAYRFGTRARQLEGQAFLQAFESLKGAGQITEIEGTKATQAIGRLDTAQSADDYREALAELKGVITAARGRAANRAGLDLPAPSAPSDTAAVGATSFSGMAPADLLKVDINSLSDAELDAYLEATSQ